MSIIQGNVKGGLVSKYTIDQSLRLNDDDSAYLSRTPSVAGNRKTWTFSTWVKRGNLDSSTYKTIIASPSSSANYEQLGFYQDKIRFYKYTTSFVWVIETAQVFRDTSNFYHIHLSVDTTQATSSNRIKLYINGEQITDFTLETYPSQNLDLNWNSVGEHTIGEYNYNSLYYLDGYLAETHFIDGQALTPDNFGEFDATYGHWKPIEYTGTYGTNGFYLPFNIGEKYTSFEETFDTDLSNWTSIGAGSAIVSNGKFTTTSYGSGSSWHGADYKQTLSDPVGDCLITISGFNKPNYSSDLESSGVSFKDADGNLICKLYKYDGHASTSNTNYYYFHDGTKGNVIKGAANLAVLNDTVTIKKTGTKLEVTSANYGSFVCTAAYGTDIAEIQIFDYRYSTYGSAVLTVDGIKIEKFTKDLDDDASGNENNFTANNLSATDIVLDSPTNNFATLNPLVLNSGAVLRDGNLVLQTANTSGANGITSTISTKNSYCEIYINSSTLFSGQLRIGLSSTTTGGNPSIVYRNDGQKAIDGVVSAYGSAFTVGDIIGIASNGTTVTFYKNNVSQGTINYDASDFFIVIIDADGSTKTATCIANFGQDSSFAGNKTPQGYTDANGIGDFYYEPPQGYLALCTANLPEPTVVPSEHFDVVTYTGNSTERDIVTSMTPDLAIIKSRSNITDHQVYDSVRGALNVLLTNATNAETTVPTYRGINTFLTNGYTLGADNSGWVNYTNWTYVAWNWKAGGTAVTNTDGTITSQVSANVDAGFSIVGWTHNGSGGTSVGHGLNKKPELVIEKNRTSTNSSYYNWAVYTDVIDGTMDYLYLNLTNAKGDSGYPLMTSTTFPTSAGATNDSMIAYCFHSVEGYSKIGTYTGNGSTDGTFVYCGFRPKYVMIERTDSTGYWEIFDAERSQDNPLNERLEANSSGAEYTAVNWLDFTSNGFKVRYNGSDVNASGGKYLFISFAESPFKYSNAR